MCTVVSYACTHMVCTIRMRYEIRVWYTTYNRKEDHHRPLLLDLAHAGLSVELVTIRMRVRYLGHFLAARVCYFVLLSNF